MDVKGKRYRTVWMDGSDVMVINQALLPHRFEIARLEKHADTARAIKEMIVRGAGAVGAAGAYGMAQAILEAPDEEFEAYVKAAAEKLRTTRPTAQNLFEGINAALRAVDPKDREDSRVKAVDAAQRYADHDASSCEAIGEYGAELIPDGARILTHCNAGWLAFVDWGSALSPIYTAKRQGKGVFVYVDETRPRCQGARLTAWELQGEGVPHAVIADNAAGFYMRRGEVDLVIVGGDRIAANGDVANKIGTYEKAVLAKENGIPFYVAAPTTTIDFDCPGGDDIPIEERPEEEVTFMFGRDAGGRLLRVRIAPEGSPAKNPAFDVTPAALVKGIITEKGVLQPGRLAEIRPERAARFHL
ncbi:MAG: S-methyl-5-thioribose-1-phosphate isomerase [Planctomycetes bacterium]|nr:S-methyl-5-thioribose-1-phosphate isomerase [Planctomycetota bacterium]